MRCFILLILLLNFHGQGALGEESATSTYSELLRKVPQLSELPIGRTAAGATFSALVSQASLDCMNEKFQLLLVTAPGKTGQSDPSLQLLEWFYLSAEAERLRNNFTLSAVPAIPPSNSASAWQFPPKGESYNNKAAMAEQYLWRWVGHQAPDLVIVLKSGTQPGLLVPATGPHTLDFYRELADGAVGKTSLSYALSNQNAGDVGLIPAIELRGAASEMITTIQKSLTHWSPEISPARKELQRRVSRTPLQLAEELSQHYGHKLDSVVYIPAVAMFSRVRLAEFKHTPVTVTEIEQVVEPYLTNSKPTVPDKTTSSHLSGHLIFAELALASGEGKYVKLVLNAADLGFNSAGTARACMPFHNEMSDSVFMGCPILSAAGRLTTNPKYYQMALSHLRFMQRLCLREDGLYRHSPLCEAAWGRGNGFPALGLALSLEYTPSYAPGYREILQSFQQHLRALLPYQDATGMWHQVIDHPESYREMSSTCMITYAMATGVRQGWLSAEEFEPAIQKAWPAIARRIGPQGEIADICTGTGKQPTLEDYFLRTAISGQDDRGGAMALLVATELARHPKSAGSR